MRLALQTDYCLRLLMYLAGCGERATIQEVADFFGISKDHLAKAAQRLARLGYIRAIRGIGGGLELARSADEISIGAVLRDIEGNVHLLECVGSTQNVCVIQPGCRLRGVLAEAERLQMDYLNSVKLSDVVRPGRNLVSLTT
ncbi:MAG: Rrf2 family transcriptional regulator [Planctomycetales bacterium]|nr:Rrf2 family transcriptional regulator [Planctomycetales bacterium]